MPRIGFILLTLLLVIVPVLQAQDAGDAVPGQIDMRCSLVITNETVTEYCAPTNSDVAVPEDAQADPDLWNCYTSDSGIQYCTLSGYTCYDDGEGGRFCFEQENMFDATRLQPADTNDQVEMSCATVGTTEYCWPADSDIEAPESAEADPDMWSCYTSGAGVQHCTLTGYTCYEDGEGNKFCFEQENMFDETASRSQVSRCPYFEAWSQSWVLTLWSDSDTCITYYPNPGVETNCQRVSDGLMCSLIVPTPNWW